MKYTQWGVSSKAQQVERDEKRDEHNQQFIQQRVKLPSGATYIVCKPAGDDSER